MERIGRDVERTLRTVGGGAALALAEITSAWPGAVGEAIARNAWPFRLARDGTLQVATVSATWAFELDRMSVEISERLAGALEEQGLREHIPTALRFRVGPVPEPGATPPEDVTNKTKNVGENAGEDDADTLSEASAVAAAIEDPELRELVARAARASLSRPPSSRRF
jgi:Dna[CI] antecedent, DciA